MEKDGEVGMKECIMACEESRTSDIPMYVQDLIRCKDCKHRDPEDGKCDSGHTIQWHLPRPDDWFCADGEPKEFT